MTTFGPTLVKMVLKLTIITDLMMQHFLSELVPAVKTPNLRVFLDLESDLYFFIFHYTVFHGASKMLQELQSSGEMKDLTFVIVFV